MLAMDKPSSSIQVLIVPQKRATDTPVDLDRARHPQYGRYLDELAPGQCEDMHWEECLFQDLEDLDTCGG